MTQATAQAAIGGRSRDGIAQRLAADLRDGYVVNLGVGIPLLIPQYIPADVEVILHAENGVLGLGPLAAPGHEDPDLTDAGKQPVTLITGAAIVDSAMSFAVVRGGHLDVTVLGALQVSARGDLANWYVPGKNPAVGGAMDLVAGAREVWVVMEHIDRAGQPKIVGRCTFPLTGREVVTRVYTDLAVFHIVDGELRLTECAPGVTPAAVRERTGAPYVEDFHPEGLRHVSTIDVSSLTAFDVHTHVHRSVRADQPPDPGGREDMGEYFRIGTMPRYTVPELADYYRQRNMACVTFTVDSISQTGHEPVPDNFEVAELAAEHADVLIPFASIDPARGAAGVAQARRLIADFGVRGFKFHPGTQAFYPNDRMAYPLYEVIAEHGLVALFHTGQTGVGAGTRGGGGIRLKYSNPLYLDDVAADFPDMDIIMAHPSFPWQDEALSIATHKPRVYIDLSGWSPKYFSPQLVQYAGSLLRDKVLFGTDFPVMTPERWIKDFENLNIKPEVRPLIMKENAARLFGLSGSASGDGP